MSREFGSYTTGYFHTQIETAAGDCESGRCEITRQWGKLLRAFTPIAYAIATAEASGSSADYPILKSIERLDAVKSAIRDIENYLSPFKDVAVAAIREHSQEDTE
jgi:hypothetical protein